MRRAGVTHAETKQGVFDAIVSLSVDRGGGDWSCRESMEQIGREANPARPYNEKTVRRCVNELVAEGKLNKTRLAHRAVEDGKEVHHQWRCELRVPKGVRRLPRRHPSSSECPGVIRNPVSSVSCEVTPRFARRNFVAGARRSESGQESGKSGTEGSKPRCRRSRPRRPRTRTQLILAAVVRSRVADGRARPSDREMSALGAAVKRLRASTRGPVLVEGCRRALVNRVPWDAHRFVRRELLLNPNALCGPPPPDPPGTEFARADAAEHYLACLNATYREQVAARRSADEQARDSFLARLERRAALGQP